MKNRRLLVVDDEPRFRDYVVRVATKLGYEVESAADGKEFMLLCEVFEPDVAVVDVVMPDIDGIEIVQWLAGKAVELHLVNVSGFTPRYATLAKMLGEARGLRSVTTLTKPVRMATLRKALSPAG